MDAGVLVSKAIDDLLDDNAKLTETLLKVKTIAILIGNQKLRLLVESELEGYAEEVVLPEYRQFPVMTRANLLTAYGEQVQRNVLVAVEYLEEELREALIKCKLRQSVIELNHLVQHADRGYLQMPITKSMQSLIQNSLYAGTDWHIHSSWRVLSAASVEAVLSTVKSKLLDILLNLKIEFGESIPLKSLQQKQAVNENINQALHSINVASGGVVNVAHGESSVQAANTGNGVVNAATGAHATQTVSLAQVPALSDLIQQIRTAVESSDEFKPQREEVEGELSRIEVQLKREEPKKSVISSSIETLNELAAGAAGTAVGHAVIELLKQATALLQ